jgi:uncharacterized protein
MQEAIIIFIQNAGPGDIKQGLAATLGYKKAVQAYQLLIAHTHQLLQDMDIPIYVYYSNVVVEDDLWQGDQMIRHLQWGKDFSNRLKHAFRDVFSIGHERVIFIEGDCYELSTDLLTHAFQCLHTRDAVIGPARGGGCYLVGLSGMISELFEHIAWHTANTAEQITGWLTTQQHPFLHLPVLTTIEEEKDLPEAIMLQL